jgi:hypothetical protein
MLSLALVDSWQIALEKLYARVASYVAIQLAIVSFETNQLPHLDVVTCDCTM